MVRSSIGWLLAGMCLWISATAAANPGTIYFTNGAQLEGEVINYQVGQPVTVRTADGAEMTYRAEDVQRVELQAAPPPVAAQPPPPVQPMPPAVQPPQQGAFVPAAGMQAANLDPEATSLMQQREEVLRTRRTGLGAPITLLAVGAALLGIGGGVFASSDWCGVDEVCTFSTGESVGLFFMSAGGALFVTGLALLPGRIIRRSRRKRRLREIDKQLRERGLNVSLAPMLPMQPGQPYGLRWHASF